VRGKERELGHDMELVLGHDMELGQVHGKVQELGHGMELAWVRGMELEHDVHVLLLNPRSILGRFHLHI